MAVISKGQTFAAGDQVTASKLNNLADNATFASGAVDNVSTQLSGGAIEHISRGGHLPPCYNATYSAATRASRGRQQRPGVCTWVRSRRCHACTRVSPRVGQSGMTMDRLHAGSHAAHRPWWSFTTVLRRHPVSHQVCFERP